MRRVIMDVDTGLDDAQAILLALRSPELKVEAITTVCGNVSLEKTSSNTLKILELAGARDIPVAKGMHRPLVREYIPVDYGHGEDGFGDQSLPKSSLNFHKMHAVNLLIERIMSEPGEISLIPVGPLTNIAMAILMEPRIVKAVKEVIIMGGGFETTPYGHGNMTSLSEFNMWIDPEAAKIVFDSGIDITAVGLDVTLDPSAVFKEEHVKYFDDKNPVDRFIVGVNKYWMRMGNRGYSPLYDPVAVAVAVDKSLVEIKSFYVDVVTMVPNDAFNRGQTVADRRPPYRVKKEPNLKVCTGIEGKRFIDFYVGRLSSKRSK